MIEYQPNMAMSIPKTGLSRFMKEGTMVSIMLKYSSIYSLQHFKGIEEAVQRNIEACVELSTQIRSAYGPNGLFFVIFV